MRERETLVPRAMAGTGLAVENEYFQGSNRPAMRTRPCCLTSQSLSHEGTFGCSSSGRVGAIFRDRVPTGRIPCRNEMTDLRLKNKFRRAVKLLRNGLNAENSYNS